MRAGLGGRSKGAGGGEKIFVQTPVLMLNNINTDMALYFVSMLLVIYDGYSDNSTPIATKDNS